ncbi:MAG TPA: hypothetical protein PLP14_03190 [Chitinophagaceae bacterium]|nr:hypothetical protein [Chitinophagaceae bacterium]
MVSVLPCADHHHDDKNIQTASCQWQNNHADHPDQENEHCPPFCTCACCGQVIYTQSIGGSMLFSTHWEPLPSDQPIAFYSSPFSDEALVSIWQPPRTL